MALQVFTTDTIGAGVQANLAAADDAWIFEGVVVASTTASAVNGTGSNHVVKLEGTVLSQIITIVLGDVAGDANNAVYIGKNGTVGSTFNIFAAIGIVGDGAIIKNEGAIWSYGGGILLSAGAAGSTATISNSGTIDAREIAIVHQGAGTLTLTNSGLITTSGSGAFASASDGIDRIFNTGRIVGVIGLGDGADTYNGATGRLSGEVHGGDGNDVVTGGGDSDFFVGDNNNDTLTGNAGNDTLDGGAGDDTLLGGLGVDNLLGQANSDTLNGGAGKDKMAGGLGNDFFVFNAPLVAANSDLITDFNRAADTIRLENAVFTKVGAAGALRTTAFKLSTQTKDADDRIIYNKATGALFYDPDGSGAQAAVQFAMLATKPTINSLDFVVI